LDRVNTGVKMGRRNKVVFLGIDAGDRDLLREWAANGDLPTLRLLMETGITGHTEGLPGLYVGAHWPSFATGCTPAKNRVYSWEQIQPGTYDHYRVDTGKTAQRPQFWDALSAAGRRVCVLDIPLSFPSKELNGLQTVEWGAHDAVHGFTSSSPELRKEIVSKFGLHPVSGNSDADRDPNELIVFRDTLLDGVGKKARLTQHFLHKERWDFFAQVFTETHCGGHLLWHLHDPDHPRHHESITRGDPLKDIYMAVDAALGEIVAGVDEDATFIVLANHGMGPKYGAQFMLDKILLALGVTAPAPAPQKRVTVRNRLGPLLTSVWQRLPKTLKQTMQPIRKRTREWVLGDEIPAPTIDPAASRCFMIQNNSSHGGIRVNLEGREPEGKVAPGAEYDALLDQLAEDLAAITNIETGHPIVKAVHRRDRLYAGPECNHLPDLMVEWHNDAPTRMVSSNKIGRIDGEYRYCRTGDHKSGGLFIVKGPHTRPMMLDRVVSCIDFAPTIAALLGVRLDDVDGTAIRELLPAEHASAQTG
jgi:predicted AlkP superfamily phosphohydrolase/phosphomutase